MEKSKYKTHNIEHLLKNYAEMGSLEARIIKDHLSKVEKEIGFKYIFNYPILRYNYNTEIFNEDQDVSDIALIKHSNFFELISGMIEETLQVFDYE